MKTYIIKLSFE